MVRGYGYTGRRDSPSFLLRSAYLWVSLPGDDFLAELPAEPFPCTSPLETASVEPVGGVWGPFAAGSGFVSRSGELGGD
jgi:hypothetical protein